MIRCGKAIVVFLCALGFFVPGLASASSQERKFEMVSPSYKGGYGVIQIDGVREDGNAVAFYSPGAFEGAPAGISEGLETVAYLATRQESGWSTTPLMPPDALSTEVLGASDFSSTLNREVVPVDLPNLENPVLPSNRVGFFEHSVSSPDVVGNWQLVGPALKTLKNESLTIGYLGASSDFCHLFFENQSEVGGEGHLLRAAETAAREKGERGATHPLYELVTGCEDKPVELRLVALNDRHELINPLCPPELGIGDAASETARGQYNAIANGGREVFFTTCADEKNTLDHQLFVRLNGERTLEVSKALSPTLEKCGETEIPCKDAGSRASADFAGASSDGSRVFFTSKAPLTGEGDTSRNLYEATIGCLESEPECAVEKMVVTSLTRVSLPVGNEESNVQGVVRIAPDGSRVYFVAQGVLTGVANAQGTIAVQGADNLYMYERNALYPAGHIAFVADVCSGHSLSGGVNDAHCPNATMTDLSLYSNEAEAQTAGTDGRYLVFSSYGQLVRDDTDKARDIYRYDAEAGILDRVSSGENGYHSNGNDSTYNARLNPGRRGETVSFQGELGSRAISEDGSRIIFTTAEPLSPGAINGLLNVYEWQLEAGAPEGRVSLISTGSAEAPTEDAVMSPGGHDIFFITSQGLVHEDGDGAPDIYDARIGGGFPEPLAGRQECSSDACQGPLTNPAPLLIPGSVSQTPGGNFEATKAPAPVVKSKKKAKGKKKKAKGKKQKIKRRESQRKARSRRSGGRR
jgi:hypothetical protein